MEADNTELRDYHPDELLAELRRREGAEPKSAADNIRLRAAGGPAGMRVAELSATSEKELIEALRFSQKVIYGVDDRKEEFQIDRPQAKSNARGVASVIDVSDIEDNG